MILSPVEIFVLKSSSSWDNKVATQSLSVFKLDEDVSASLYVLELKDNRGVGFWLSPYSSFAF